MDYVKLILTDKHYRYSISSSIEMTFLALFLTDDVGCFWPTYRTWIDDDSFQEMGGNCTNLRKESDSIILSNEYLGNDIDGGPYLTIPKSQYIHILDEWEKVCKTKPKEIMITKEGDKFSLQIIQ